MADDPLPSLADLGRRLTEARQNSEALSHVEDDANPVLASQNSSAFGSAMRLGVEFVSGFVVGGLIGWTLDRWLGTRPWLLIVFFFLGAAAGTLNLVRAANRLQMEAEQSEGKKTGNRAAD